MKTLAVIIFDVINFLVHATSFLVIKKPLIMITVQILIKVGGLDSRDQSRSRSRTSFVSRLTFENCRDYPSCRGQNFLSSVEIFKIETFQSRLGCVEIIETYRDYRDKSRKQCFFQIIEIFVETFWKKFEFTTLFAQFEANFEAQNVNK